MVEHKEDEGQIAGLINATVTAAGDLVQSAALAHEEWHHEGGSCPENRIEVVAYIAYRLGIPADAFDAKDVREVFQEVIEGHALTAEADAAPVIH